MSNTRFRLPTITIGDAWSWTWPKSVRHCSCSRGMGNSVLVRMAAQLRPPGPIDTFAAFV